MRAGKASPDIRSARKSLRLFGLMKAGEETAPTPSNYGYTLRRAMGAPRVAHSSRNISLRFIFPLRPDTAPFWRIERAPCRDVLDQIRPAAGLRISYFVIRHSGLKHAPCRTSLSGFCSGI